MVSMRLPEKNTEDQTGQTICRLERRQNGLIERIEIHKEVRLWNVVVRRKRLVIVARWTILKCSFLSRRPRGSFFNGLF